jgi:hypothetical protein
MFARGAPAAGRRLEDAGGREIPLSRFLPRFVYQLDDATARSVVRFVCRSGREPGPLRYRPGAEAAWLSLSPPECALPPPAGPRETAGRELAP